MAVVGIAFHLICYADVKEIVEEIAARKETAETIG
jgi:hypothetical protein